MIFSNRHFYKPDALATNLIFMLHLFSRTDCSHTEVFYLQLYEEQATTKEYQLLLLFWVSFHRVGTNLLELLLKIADVGMSYILLPLLPNYMP